MMNIQEVAADELPAGHEWLLVEGDNGVTVFVAELGRTLPLADVDDMIRRRRDVLSEVAEAAHAIRRSRLTALPATG